MLADMGFKVAEKQKAYFSDITVKNYRFPSNAIFKDTNASNFSGKWRNKRRTKLSCRKYLSNNQYYSKCRANASHNV
jgi:hypothetical protein